MRFRRGWRKTGCSQMQPRLKSFGVHRHDLNTRSRLVLFMSVMPWSRQSLQPGILMSTSTPASPWGPNLSTPSERVLQQCAGRSVACDGLPQHTLLTLIRTLVITKLDQCNSVLVGTSAYLQDQLQSMLNAAVRLVYSRRTPLLRELHWLRVPERIQFWLCIMAYHCVHGTAPAYLSDSVRTTSEIVDVYALLTPRHYRWRRLVGLPLATAPFRWLQRVDGTVCH